MSEPNDPPVDPPAKSSAALRTMILIGLLALIVAGGLWDRYGAKDPRDQAYNRVLVLQTSHRGDGVSAPASPTQADVRKALGTAPSETMEEEGVIYERYSWRRGIPWQTYDLWILYRNDEDKEMLVAQPGEEGKPHPVYAANSGGGGTPLSDPEKTSPIAEGASPAGEAGAGDQGAEDAGDDDAAAPTEEAGAAPGSDDASAEAEDAVEESVDEEEAAADAP